LTLVTEARADLRALVVAASLGSAFGLALGGLYLAGGLAQTASSHAKIERLADAASSGFSDTALTERADPGTLQIARRLDRNYVATGVDQDRQAALFALRLERRSTMDNGSQARINARGLLMHANYSETTRLSLPPLRGGRFNALTGARELDCLTQAVYYEARGETPSGQAAVAQVVLNRVRHPAFPKTICAVVFQRADHHGGCQFSFACDGSMRQPLDRAAWNRAERVASRALDGVSISQIGKATHFHTTSVSPEWGTKLLRVAQVGLHVFYRFGSGTYVPALPINGPGLTGPALDAANQALYASLVPQAAHGEAPIRKAVGLDNGVEAAAMVPKAAVPRAVSPFEVDKAGVTETSALSPKEVPSHSSSASGA
jgi:spore germination cell wall hydrolase CwlJ-like protein